MKKAIIIFSLSLFAIGCSNETEQQTKSASVTARGEVHDDASAIAQASAAYQAANPSTPISKTRIVCHTNYSYHSGNVCVEVNGTIFNCEWVDAGMAMPPHDTYYTTYWNVTVSPRCSCGA